MKFFAGVHFCRLVILYDFCDKDKLVFLAGNWFLRFSGSTQYQALIIFSFLLSTCNRNTYYFLNNKPVFGCFVSGWKRQVAIEQTRFLILYFCVANLSQRIFYSGVNFCGKNVWSNIYLWQLIFADCWKNRKKLELAKILCHTVGHDMIKCRVWYILCRLTSH